MYIASLNSPITTVCNCSKLQTFNRFKKKINSIHKNSNSTLLHAQAYIAVIKISIFVLF